MTYALILPQRPAHGRAPAPLAFFPSSWYPREPASQASAGKTSASRAGFPWQQVRLWQYLWATTNTGTVLIAGRQMENTDGVPTLREPGPTWRTPCAPNQACRQSRREGGYRTKRNFPSPRGLRRAQVWEFSPSPNLGKLGKLIISLLKSQSTINNNIRDPLQELFNK